MENTRMEMKILKGEKVNEQKPKQYNFFNFTQEKVGGERVNGKNTD